MTLAYARTGAASERLPGLRRRGSEAAGRAEVAMVLRGDKGRMRNSCQSISTCTMLEIMDIAARMPPRFPQVIPANVLKAFPSIAFSIVFTGPE